MRFFNTEGPVNCQDHYCLPPLSRLDMEDVEALISQKKYFVLHAPRQTGYRMTSAGGWSTEPVNSGFPPPWDGRRMSG